MYTYVDCKTVGFFLKISKEIGLSPVSLSVFSLIPDYIPDLLFDCSRVLEYAKIRTVLQSNTYVIIKVNKSYSLNKQGITINFLDLVN